MQFLSHNWPVIAFIISCLGGGAGGYLLVKKVDIPNMKKDISCLQDEVSQFNGGVDDIKKCVNTLKKEIQHDRKIAFGFMVAVKEKLDLKFILPKD